MNKKPENTYLSTQQAADLLGISRTAILKRIKKGEINADKIGRNYIIHYGNLVGELSEDDKKDIKKTVKKAVKEYGETFKLLGKE